MKHPYEAFGQDRMEIIDAGHVARFSISLSVRSFALIMSLRPSAVEYVQTQQQRARVVP